MIAVAVLSFLLLVYTLVGYPVVMRILKHLKPIPVAGTGMRAPLSIIVCVKDEASRIVDRIENLLSLDYPQELLEIVVVSDGSRDGTPDVVMNLDNAHVKLIHYKESKGKAYALNQGIAASSHELLLLCDARQTIQTDAARLLVGLFADDTIGAVSGRLVIKPKKSDAAVEALGTYWGVEVGLRHAESVTGSAVGVTGALYALRKSCFRPIPEGTILDDVLIPMQAVMEGKRVLFEPDAIAIDELETAKEGELSRKVRTLYGNLQLIKLAPDLFNPRCNPIWWRFISHKILRLFLPLSFAMCCVGSLFGGGIWTAFGLFQLLGWGAAFLAWNHSLSFPYMKMLATLYLLNYAIVKAWYLFLSGRDDVWQHASSNKATPSR